MNIEVIKEDICRNVGKKVKVKVNGMRNKSNTYIGTVSSIYPFIFTVMVDGDAKSFSYAEVITGEVELNYL